jgi:predicted PurR-regulated permease PerM
MSLPPPSAREARLIWLALSGLAIAVLVALVAGLVLGLSFVVRILSPVLWPLAVAGVLAYLLDPVVDFFESRPMSRPKAITTVFAIALLVLGIFFGSIVPQLVTETRELAARIPHITARAQERAEDWLSHPPPLLQKLIERLRGSQNTAAPATPAEIVTNAPSTNLSPAEAESPQATPVTTTNNPAFLGGGIDKQTLRTASGWVAKALTSIGGWVASWFGILAGVALVPVYTFYFLLEKRAISSNWTDYLPVADSRFKEELVFVLSSINNYLIAFFRGQVLVAISDGILYGIGFLLIGLPYAILIGVGAMALTIIPFLGAITICFTALIIAAVNFADWSHPLLVLLVFAIVQSLEGVIISPRIMGGRVGLHPVTIIIAVMAGTTLLGGLLGGVLAIPLTAALRVVMFRYVWKRAQNKTAPIRAQPV